MTRLAILTLLAAVAFAPAATAQLGELAAPALKAEVVVKSEIVRIGDLVDNAGAVADVPIFRAPDLGETGSVSAKAVADAVRQHHIIGLDTRGLSEVVVTRASRMLTAKDFEARIERALAGQTGAQNSKNLTLTFDNEVRTLHVEPEGTELRIARLNYEPRSGRFDVTFEIAGSMVRRRPLRFTGTLTETFEALVPARPLTQGEIIRASDLTPARLPKSQYAATVITTATQMTGLAARHALRAGQLLRQADLMRPELVGRGETVLITYQVPGIMLTVRGEAKEPGALGDTINVVNVQSKKMLQATVIGPGRVSAGGAPARFAANATPVRP
jgi:flagella basal body P-ring formation protein FlgA